MWMKTYLDSHLLSICSFHHFQLLSEFCGFGRDMKAMKLKAWSLDVEKVGPTSLREKH